MQRDERQIGLSAQVTDAREFSPELRRWIERVIVPILVKDFLGLHKDEDHG
jgi:hypothetical protein